MTAPIEMADFAATVTRPTFFPATTHPDPPQVPAGPWGPSTDPDLPVAVDPALAGWQPPTLDDLGLTTDPAAIALEVLGQLTDEQLDAVLAYYPPADPTAADYQLLTAELDAQHASLIAIPADAWEHRQKVAADHRAKQQAARERLDAYYLDMREAA